MTIDIEGCEMDAAHVFFTGDHHFRQAVTDARAHDRDEGMDERRIARWNEKVGPEDVVFYVGDFCDGDAHNPLAWMIDVGETRRRLNGRIFLVKGNHDRLSNADYRQAGFEEVYDRPILLDDLIIVSHSPQEWFDRLPSGVKAVYGHVHDAAGYPDATGNTFCCCVERTGDAPASLKEIVERMEAASAAEPGKQDGGLA